MVPSTLRAKLFAPIAVLLFVATSPGLAAPPGGPPGRDADLLDGLDSTQFLRSDVGGAVTGSLTVTEAGFNTWIAQFQHTNTQNGNGVHIQTATAKAVDAALFVETGAGDALMVRNNGNVGVGTRNPQERLDVAGTVRISGAGSGLVFPDGTRQTTAATGTASSGIQVLHVARPAHLFQEVECDNQLHPVQEAIVALDLAGPATLDITSSLNAIIHSQTDVFLTVDGADIRDSLETFSMATGRATFHSGTVLGAGPGEHTVGMLVRCWSGGSITLDNAGSLTVRAFPG